MTHDVFISYPSENKPIADAVCAKLEENHIRCWIAPRDILPGQNYAEALFDAIGSSSIFILILSENTNHSPHIISEVQRAFNTNRVLIPFRIEDIEPSKALQYYLGSSHWLDALTPPIEKKIDELVTVVKINLHITSEDYRAHPTDNETKQENVPELTEKKTQKTHSKINLSVWFVPILLLAVVFIVFFFIIFNGSPSNKPVQPESFNGSVLTTTGTPSVYSSYIPKSNTYTKQCDGISFDSSKQSCCYGVILDGKWKESYDRHCYNSDNSSILYCGGVTYIYGDGMDCCNGTAYNKEIQNCCISKVEPGGGYWQTCGNSCYNYDTHHCCNGKIVEGGPAYWYGECGNICYDKRLQSCCNDQLYQGKDRCCYRIVNSPICSEGMQCCNDKDNGPTCYNPKTQWCLPAGLSVGKLIKL